VNAPNVLTMLRIVLVPFLIFFLQASFRGHEIAALAVFLLASLTDTVDGFLARRTNKITALGQLLDPIADKLLVSSAFISLVGIGSVQAWMAVVIIGRELGVTGFRAVAASRGVVIPASWPGKLKMALETITVSLLVLGKGLLGRLWLAAEIGLWLVLAAAVWSAAHYFWKYGPAVIKAASDE
jgi:CDP-diacylglycerol---glycerol-3-phosphate 3-phosphatidyltransferase